MLGQIKKFFGLELPSGYQRANDFIAKNSDYPEFFRAMEGSLEKVGDDRFYIPSGEDRYLINREVPTDKTWIGGQRIYRYGLEYPTVRTSSGTDDITIPSSLSTFYFTNVFGFIQSSSLFLPLPNNQGSGSAHDIKFSIDITSGLVRVNYAANPGSGFSGYVFIEYIKSMAKSQSNYIVQVSPNIKESKG